MPCVIYDPHHDAHPVLSPALTTRPAFSSIPYTLGANWNRGEVDIAEKSNVTRWRSLKERKKWTTRKEMSSSSNRKGMGERRSYGGGVGEGGGISVSSNESDYRDFITFLSTSGQPTSVRKNKRGRGGMRWEPEVGGRGAGRMGRCFTYTTSYTHIHSP